MINRRLMLRTIRRLYTWSRRDPVDEELRGWNWDKPPLRPRAYLELGVSEVASKYCETRRDIWLRRKVGAKPGPSEPLSKGRLIHEAISLAISEASKLIVHDWTPWSIYEFLKDKWRRLLSSEQVEYAKLVESIYKQTLLTILGELAYEDAVKSNRSQPVLISEFRVDGGNLGLSQNLSVDVVLEGGVIVDFKYGAPREFHKLSLAGYALALESEFEVPYDYGLLIYINDSNGRFKTSYKPIYINSHVRRWFIEERDEIIDMLIENREPPVDSQCYSGCPYLKVCHP
jgi:CRISPR-associated protein Csa1